MRTLTAASTALAVAALAVTGCADSEEPRNRPVPATAERPRPLTDAETLRIADAQQRLIGRCMAGKGFEYWEAERLSLRESRTLGYVADDVGWARAYGYGSRIHAKEDEARRNNRNAAYRAALPPERRTAYDRALDEGPGAPEMSVRLPSGGVVRKRVGGCVADSEKRLYGDPEAWFRADKVAGSAGRLLVPKVMADKEFTAALAAWSRCLKRAGHTYANPGDARDAALLHRLGAAPGEAFEAERALAVADAACARSVKLRSIGQEREKHYVNQLDGVHREALDTRARLQHRALERAMKIVGPRT
ncbi:hypothetical protein [Streptomyces sp. Tu 3180]|uniref:hypothetical protein n=1 Tax=Streptomyces sp. Tu 3180 TaxID=2682611 RepID=UPI001358C44E|nr:hypothetical protein [Streptomyces sp. Tu 3180]KAF3463499.1 hypothetical protein GL259_03640 [Streptomyces sp. Tu 3180]